MSPDNNLGDPVNFSTFLMWQLARTDGIPEKGHTEWNMDSDRGYAFKSWDWARTTAIVKKDIEGHDYAAPCSVLSQLAGDDAGAPNPDYFAKRDPLDLVYLDATMQNELDGCSQVQCYQPDGGVILRTHGLRVPRRNNNDNPNNNNRDEIIT